ncbi:MAG: tetratricopeptide repeat protein [Anaerolineae bacterium]|nr:tetratricopeptide repeat protein [Anaerolineae bacterium]
MADREAYQAAMREAASAAWDQNYQQAVTLYQRALDIVPDDAQALAGLALSLMEIGQQAEALKAYGRVSQLVPNDPLPLEKIAQILEDMNQIGEAAKRYQAVAELYFARREINSAIPNWERAVQLNPDLPQPHVRLAMIYEKNKDTQQLAIYEYLSIARLLQQFNQLPKAEQALQRAMQIDPTHADVRSALADFRRGVPLQTVGTPIQKRATAPARKEVDEESEEIGAEEVVCRSPADESAHYSLGLLADLVWSDQVSQAGIEPLVKAIELHQVGSVNDAIANYSKVLKTGLNHPALNFNLGLLYLYSEQYDEAFNMLSRELQDPDYGLAANLGVGQIYYTRNDVHKASEHLIEALLRADTLLNDQVDQGGYERLKGSLADQSVEYLNDLCRALLPYLDDVKWREKLTNTLTGYAAQGKASYVPDLIELVLEGGRPEMAASMERIDIYMSRTSTRLAQEEIYYAIEKSPDYLPAHRRIADILVKEGRTQDAAIKINLVANTYLMRGNPDKAADLYAEVIELWPADMAARQKVIDMLKEQGRVTEALYHWIEMADFHHRLMADTNKATEVYLAALDYARKNDADPARTIPILKALADIEAQQLNARKALSYYEQIVEIAPDDQDTALAVITLHFQMGQSDKAIAALDSFIRYCITRGEAGRAVSVLEEQSRLHPNEIGLRQRLADVYRQQKRIPEAIAQMDAIGELLLDANRIDEAALVIRKIVEMNPQDVEGYRKLLSQLQSSGSSSG